MTSLNQTLADHLLERLLLFRLKPQSILNTGLPVIQEGLLKQYPNSAVENSDMQQASLPLSFKTNTFDMIFSNLIIFDRDYMPEFTRILKPEGVWLFTTLGRDSFRELDQFGFPDMHNIGDALAKHFADPVMDVEYLTLEYDSVEKLKEDLDSFQLPLDKNPPKMPISVTLELIYGHGFGKPPASDEVKIPLSAINKRTRS